MVMGFDATYPNPVFMVQRFVSVEDVVPTTLLRRLKIIIHQYHMALLFVSVAAAPQMIPPLNLTTILPNGNRASTSTNKGKGKAADSDSDAEQGIRVTAKSERRRTGGMFVDEVIPITLVPESWDVPAATNRVAYILDLSGTPKLLQSGRKTLTVDAFIKKECQDSFTGPTGSKSDRSLAKVMILNDDSDEPVLCRRSTLTCSGCYKCTLASDDFLEDCRRWDDTDAPHSLISAPIMTAKASEANSVAAIASAFYRGVVETYCKGQHLDSDIPCGGRAILRKFSQVLSFD
ncbi:hypothetical protein B0H10DRAFT_2233105 [Mycena sp. CBHHK59/15]|nr:hypothetical protein B0H10DRAFT_2233105 [Mycena sp. CBHHK59/15]